MLGRVVRRGGRRGLLREVQSEERQGEPGKEGGTAGTREEGTDPSSGDFRVGPKDALLQRRKELRDTPL